MTTPTDEARRNHPDFKQEQGTALDWADAMFINSMDGEVIDYSDFHSRDLNDMLTRDHQARKLESVLSLPHRRAGWLITPPKKGDTGQTEWLNDFLQRGPTEDGMKTSIDQVIGWVTSARTHRRSYMEKVFKKDSDGRVIYEKLAYRPATTCRMIRDPKNGGFRGFIQQPLFGALQTQTIEPIRIKAHRAFVHINGQHRDPTNGISDLDIAYWCYTTKRKVMLLWFSFLESTSLPRVMVTAPELGKAQEIARNMAAMKASGILPVAGSPSGANAVSAQVLDTSGKGADQYLAALSYLDTAAANSVLAGFTDLSTGASQGRGTTSYALSRDASHFYLQQEAAVGVEMAASITYHALADLVRFNFGPKAPVPTFNFKPLTDEDVTQQLALLTGMVSAPNSAGLPTEFTELLVMQISERFELDTDKVRAAFETADYKARLAAAQAKAVAPPIPPMAPGGPLAAGPNGSRARAAGAAAVVNTATNIAKAASDRQKGK